jgi:hypothetical protein
MKRSLLEMLIYVSVLAALYGGCYGLCRAYNAARVRFGRRCANDMRMES